MVADLKLTPRPSNWESLNPDLSELIFSLLPVKSLIRASAVCQQWRSIITTSPSFSSKFSSTSKKPWFFLYGQNNIFPKNNQLFAFDPELYEWIKLPTSHFPPKIASQEHSFTGSGGFFLIFTNSNARVHFAPILSDYWQESSPLWFSGLNPLVGVFNSGSNLHKFIVVGGVSFIGGLLEIEDNLAVEIYESELDRWRLCSPLPAAFELENSSQSLCSAMFKGKFYVSGINSCFVSAFDLVELTWSDVQTLRPSGVVFSFLIACLEYLVLVAMCNGPFGSSVVLWRVNERTMDLREIASMPLDLLDWLFDNSSEEDDRFASLKCVGLGNLIYVFNEDRCKSYPACVCEIDDESGVCSWRRVPPLPSPVNSFHKINSFCSPILLESILRYRD